MKKAILVTSDGYSIRHEFFNTIEEARHKMVSEYSKYEIWSFDQEYADLCFCGDNEATVYNNGECVYTWAVIELPSPPKEKLYYVEDNTVRKVFTGSHEQLVQKMCELLIQACAEYDIDDISKEKIDATIRGNSHISEDDSILSFYVIKDYASLQTYDGCETFEIKESSEECLK